VVVEIDWHIRGDRVTVPVATLAGIHTFMGTFIVGKVLDPLGYAYHHNNRNVMGFCLPSRVNNRTLYILMKTIEHEMLHVAIREREGNRTTAALDQSDFVDDMRFIIRDMAIEEYYGEHEE